MGMAVAVLVVRAVTVFGLVLVRHAARRTRRPWREHVPMGPAVCVAMDTAPVAVGESGRGQGFDVSAAGVRPAGCVRS